MTLKQLLKTNTWLAISDMFLKLYPDAEINIKGYEAAFQKLKIMDPEGSEILIVISQEKDDDDDDDEEYIDVSGIHNYPKNEEENYSQGLELTPWRKWLGMTISKESFKDFSELEIIIHCLYEMTFVGFSEEDIQKRINRIENNRQERKLDTDGENYVSASSIDELLKRAI